MIISLTHISYLIVCCVTFEGHLISVKVLLGFRELKHHISYAVWIVG